MPTGAIVAIVAVVIVVAALIAVAAFGARRRRLQQRFGPEYDRAVEGSDSRLKAEAELAERERRVKKLDIRPLDPAARDRYAADWTAIQEQFVDSPADAVTGAQTLITSVMTDRGYPTEDSDQIMADLSVGHASTLDEFRTAQDLSSRAASGTASTEDLRLAMVHYRALFRELLGEPDGTVEAEEAGVTEAGGTEAGVTEAGVTEPSGTEPSVTRPSVIEPAADDPNAEGASTPAAGPVAASATTRSDAASASGSGAELTTPESTSPEPTDPALSSTKEPLAEQADAPSPAPAARPSRRR